MTVVDLDRLFLRAADIVPKLPRIVSSAIFRSAAELAATFRLAGVPQLERNYRRIRPGATDREIRRLVRRGMRSYMRYYEEALRLQTVTPEQLAQRVRIVDEFGIREHVARGGVIVAALGHLANWDLAGAWCSRHLMPVLTVAERLRPPELFEYFVRVRTEVGMTIIPADRDGSTFRELLRHSRNGPLLVPLLADRDLSRHGIEVDLFGHPAKVAAGPATLSVAIGAPLMPVVIHYERLRGARRQAAGGPWGIVVRFRPPVAVPSGDRRHVVTTMTQAWVDDLARGIAARPEDWHMLQPIFTADMDPRRGGSES